LPRQSGRKIRAAAIAAASTLACLPAAAGQVDWAHQNGRLQSNGAVSVRSVSGTNYTATQNPSGAVAKATQSAATQPATIVVQATSGGYAEIIPFLTTGTTNLPTCPSGYSRIFSATSASFGFTPSIFNAAGSRFSLAGFNIPSNGNTFYGWLIDSVPTAPPQNVGTNGAVYATNSYWYPAYPPAGGWAAALCSK
jgi:hypothetical protein